MNIHELAIRVGKDWKSNPWYDRGEIAMPNQWDKFIWPAMATLDLTNVVDLAAGHGRCSEKLLQAGTKNLFIVDINEENIDFCTTRFKGRTNISYAKTDGLGIPVPSEWASLVFCWDSMVHFDSDVIRSYLQDIYRVLKPGGHAFCHHSNLTDNPNPYPLRSPGGRNFMSRELFAHYSIKHGLKVVQQRVIDWSAPNLDCITLLRRPSGGGD